MKVYPVSCKINRLLISQSFKSPSKRDNTAVRAEFLVGVCRPVPQILTRFQTKKCDFPHRFSDQTSQNPYPFSDLAFRQNLCLHYLAIRVQTKNQSNPFRIHMFLFLAYSFGTQFSETIKIRSYTPQFPRKPYSMPDQNGQIVCPFSDQNGTKTLPDGAAHTYMAYIRECRDYFQNTISKQSLSSQNQEDVVTDHSQFVTHFISLLHLICHKYINFLKHSFLNRENPFIQHSRINPMQVPCGMVDAKKAFYILK